MKYIILIIAVIVFTCMNYSYNQRMDAKLNYYMSAHPECMPPANYKNKFKSFPKSKQVAIIKGCAVSHSYAYFVQALIDGEPK